MAITYDTLGSTVTITPTGFVAPEGLNTNVAIVGGYDSANGNATAGEAATVTSSTEADNEFGPSSELSRQAALAFTNGATAVYGVPVAETQTTETFGSSTATASGTLTNTPAFDPRVQPDHEITATDVTAGTSMTVNEVYGTPTSPTNSDTININPRTGSWEADETSEYDITYTYGDYGNAITAAIDQPVRAVGVCTEDPNIIATLLTELSTAESNFRFMRGVVGAEPDIQSGEISGYSPAQEDWRLVEVAPARGSSSDGGARTAGAIAGLLASQPVDVTGSITYDTVGGLTGLNVKYAPTEAEQFTQVTAITDEDEVAEGVTTSPEQSFRDIYKVEIIDLIVEQLYQRIKAFAGGSNAQSARRVFRSRLKRVLASYAAPSAQPPLLATGTGGQPYSVTTGLGATDTETDVNIGIEVAPIAKEVNLDMSVGPIRFLGASTS